MSTRPEFELFAMCDPRHEFAHIDLTQTGVDKILADPATYLRNKKVFTSTDSEKAYEIQVQDLQPCPASRIPSPPQLLEIADESREESH